jgi:phage-related holin
MNEEAIKQTAAKILFILHGALIAALGPINFQIGYLLLVVAVDFILGVWAAKRMGVYNARYAWTRSLEKFIIYMIWIVIFHSLDMVANLPGTARWLCILALLGQEIMSSLRNTGRIGHVGIVSALGSVYESITNKYIPGYPQCNQHQDNNQQADTEGGGPDDGESGQEV